MDNKKLSGVPDTLFIPLMARIYVSKRFPEYFYDEKALSLEKLIPQNVITEKSSEYTMMGSASRAVNMDKIVAEFANKTNTKLISANGFHMMPDNKSKTGLIVTFGGSDGGSDFAYF